MTPYEVIAAPTLPAGVECLALGAVPVASAGWQDVLPLILPVRSVVWSWSDSPIEPAGLGLIGRTCQVEITPSDDGVVRELQAVCLIDRAGGPEVLAVMPMLNPPTLSGLAGVMEITGPIYAQKAQ